MAELGALSTSGVVDATTSEESLLLERLNRVEQNPFGFYAVHLHLSELRQPNRQPHYLNIAARIFDNIINNHDATLFPLDSADLILVCQNVPVDDVDSVIDRVRSLFNEDPLTLSHGGSFEDQFSTWYDLSTSEDFAVLFKLATGLAKALEKKLKKEELNREGSQESKGNPLSPMNLAMINQKLQETQVNDMVHQQTCLHLGTRGDGRVMFHENFISMRELKKKVAPDVNLFASPWLFQYLTETLDRRMLGIMAERDFDLLKEPISVNLNISTVLSRAFQNFHKAVGDNTQKVVVEMQIIDIFSDINSYGYARDSLQEMGYQVLVDGLSPTSLQFFDPAQLRSDLIKISWGSEFESDDNNRVAELREVIARIGKDGVILARVDTEKAIKWGVGIGVSRFQGYVIDKLVKVIRGVKQH